LKFLTEKKWLALSLILVVSFISLLIVVPVAFGSQFVSVSFKLRYSLGQQLSPPYLGMMEVVYYNGSIIPITYAGLSVNVTNHYPSPVQVRYNGLDYVWLIYNHTVTDPADVVSNKDFLVWGAYYGFDGITDGKTVEFRGNIGYDFYVANKDRSDFTKWITSGTAKVDWLFYFVNFGEKVWYGQDRYGNPIEPGIYYHYSISFGKVSEPFVLNVTSVLWSN